MRLLSVLSALLLPALVVAQFPTPEQYDARIKPKDREHWAFRCVRASPIPVVKDVAWVRTPIDAFILATLESTVRAHAPPAEPRAGLRRAYLDLTGLPPTLAEQDAFLRDPSPDALDRLIDDLLARPAYGERYARRWLDLARYADSNAYERDALKPSVWRFRDYVIRSFNADTPFDRFIREQIAGDELPDATAETVIAAGFRCLGPWADEPAAPETDRFDQLDDIVSTTAQVFLVLTLACARCHDHKFEALTMHDYYRIVAVFDPLKRPQNGRTELDDWAAAGEARAKLARRDEAIYEMRRKDTLFRMVGGGGIDVSTSKIEAVRHEAPDPRRGYFRTEESPTSPVTHILLRGSADRPGAKVNPGLPAVLAERQPEFLTPSTFTTRRRLSLANWITDPHNPLTARVIVNRIWQWHFGDGLVRTESDFGVMGQKPTHPELLDWLADWFVQEGW